MRVFISAGEASGDVLGANLLGALKARVPNLDAFGMGGVSMRQLDFRAVRDATEVSVVGLFEVIRHIPRLLGVLSDLERQAVEARPDVAILIDAPDFNIRLAKRLKKANIPVVFYVGPSIWAWRPGRARRYAPVLDRLLVLFPFEVDPWKAAGVDVVCVGHPLVDEIPNPAPDPLGEAEEGRTVALLPGSRRSEIDRHLETLLEAAALMKSQSLADRFVLPVAPTVDQNEVQATVDASAAAGSVELVPAPAGDPTARREAIAASSLAIVASGTATLETALIGRPQVIVYKVSWLTWWLLKPFVKVAFLGLANLIAGRQVAPELLQGNFTASRIADSAKALLSGEPRAEAVKGNHEIRARLMGAGAAERAAEAVLEVLERQGSLGGAGPT